MSSIWKIKNITLGKLNQKNKNTLMEVLDIRYTAIGDDFLQATMPVNTKTHQPMGLLHGGASAALAETVGSIAGALCVDPAHYTCVGMELNCNHVKGIREGLVTATATPLHLGRATQVWDVKIRDSKDALICVSRLTLAVVPVQK